MNHDYELIEIHTAPKLSKDLIKQWLMSCCNDFVMGACTAAIAVLEFALIGGLFYGIHYFMQL